MNDHSASPVLFLHQYSVTAETNYHNSSFDFIYVLSGELEIGTRTDKAPYHAGDVCLRNPDQDYCLKAEHANVVLHMGISADFVHSYLPEAFFLRCDSGSEPDADYTEIKRILGAIASAYMEDAEQNALAIQGYLMLLLRELKNGSARFLPPDITEKIPHKYQKRIRKLLDYMDTHYGEDLTLPEIADAVFLSPQYVSGFFKKYMGTTFKKMLNEKRLRHAKQELTNTNDSVTEIALRNGFANANTFYKNFAAMYGTSPQDYRKERLLKQTEENINSLFSAAAASHDESTLPQTVSVDVSCEKGERPDVCTMINIGAAVNLLSQKFRKELLAVCSSSGFRYVRMQELISDAFIPRLPPDYDFFLHNVSSIITFLYQNQLVPVIELSKKYFYCSAVFISCGESRKWHFFPRLEAFLAYCAIHWPVAWLSQWKFELWFSPSDSMEEYIEDFQKIRQLIVRYFSSTSLGGPGYDFSLSSYSLDELFSTLRRKHVRLDFVSVYLNWFVSRDQTLQISTDAALLAKRGAETRALVEQYFPQCEIYVTEWTSAYIRGLPISQSQYQAAFICKSVMDLQETCDMLGYWLFMDQASSELFELHSFDYWEQGLLSTDSVRLSGYYAFDFLRKCGHTIVQQGKNYLVTQTVPEHYQIIVFNYAHFDPAHIWESQKNCGFERIYDVFEHVSPIDFHIVLSNLQSGFYRLTHCQLDEYHGSYLDILIGEYIHSNIEREKFLQYAREPFGISNFYRTQACVPEERTIYIYVEHTLKLPSLIPPHCICLWEIQKLAASDALDQKYTARFPS